MHNNKEHIFISEKNFYSSRALQNTANNLMLHLA